MFTYVLIPFILVLNEYVENERPNFPKEYVFSYNNTVVRQRVTLEHIQTTGKLTCQNSPLDYPLLRCFLQNVTYISPDKSPDNKTEFENSKYTVQVVEDEMKYNQTFWFEVNFNEHGAQSIRVKEDYKKIVIVDSIERQIIIDMIEDIGYLFKVDSDKIGKNLIMQPTSGSSVFTSTETTTIGNCKTKYNMTVTFNEINDKPPFILQIIPPVLSKISTEGKDMYRYSHIQIEKNRPSCHYWGLYDYSGTLIKHNYKMEMIKDKLKISNTISVGEQYNPEELLELDETTLLNLIDINYKQSEQPYDWNDPSGWMHIDMS